MFSEQKAVQNDLWTQEAVEGRWESMMQSSSYAFIAHTAEHISGSVLFSLSRGSYFMAGINACEARYIRDRDDWESKTAKQRSLRELELLPIRKNHLLA